MQLDKQLKHAPWPLTATLGVCVGLALGALSALALIYP